jgi:selenide, water dikinase
MTEIDTIKLTAYSHGAGCGCKISPKNLEQILKGNISMPNNQNLLVGNSSKDDAAVYDLGGGKALISTTDFFMPIVDDAFTFGKIAATNAISDVYAMGGKPILAIAILGWPVNTIPVELASKVLDGARQTCIDAGISLAGGHSIDAPEPIFGLAVNGIVEIKNLKRNDTAQLGDRLYLSKGLGVGVLSTAQKKGLLMSEHEDIAVKSMTTLNTLGEKLAEKLYVHALTDVTGFGLLGHLIEMAEGSGLSAEINFDQVPVLDSSVFEYISKACIPGGTKRNWDAYGHKVGEISPEQKHLLADPQTSGGLLIAVSKDNVEEFESYMQAHLSDHFIRKIGRMIPASSKVVQIL